MKKQWILLLIVSGIGIGILFMTPVRADSAFNQSLKWGNTFFYSENYEEASIKYMEASDIRAENPKVNANLGFIALKKANYESATQYFEKTNSHYLELGNAHYYLGVKAAEPSEQMTLYQNALDSYKTGILLDSKDVNLKYNYEFVANLLDELEQKQQDQEDEQQEDQEGEQQENQEGEQQEDQEGQSQEDQEGQSQDQEAEDSDQEQEASPVESGEKESGDEAQSTDGEVVDTDSEQIQQILQLLEQQEADSLKNNQGILVGGKEEGNDW